MIKLFNFIQKMENIILKKVNLLILLSFFTHKNEII